MRRPPLALSLLILTSLALVTPIARPADLEPVGAGVGGAASVDRAVVGSAASVDRAVVGSAASVDRAATVGSVFFVGKSENRNEVHYGIALDAACRPAGSAPVFAYWRMRERGPFATEPLLAREVSAYGVAVPQRIERADRGGRVVFQLNALPRRSIAIDAAPDGQGCTATARVMIDGKAAALTSVFVQLRWPFGVDYLELSGRAGTDGRVVRERL